MARKIYALSDPITSEVFYIGRTELPLETRLKGHIWDAKNNNTCFTAKDSRIRELLLKDMPPIIGELELVSEYLSSFGYEARELFWITEYIKRGHELTNVVGTGKRTSQKNKVEGKKLIPLVEEKFGKKMEATEVVKISKEKMDQVREIKKRTDVPITKILDKAISSYLEDEKVKCEGCAKEVLLSEARMDDEDANWWCPNCIKEMKQENE